ncbi:MAG: Y-family DNA polymerase [Bacteriovoracaceae bacterium]|nr:Y-family DNA polymerase [Bacteriovoracaceae bacterium]
MRYFCLVDCNSFYCSCERVFHPETRNRPVIVLSNNDGCAIAFTKEAKAVGFGQMCEPFFQLKDRIKKYNVAVFSSNYTLYDSMSKRVMDILREFSPDMEIYSVDEAFLQFEGFDHYDFMEYGQKIRKDILVKTGIPVGVGISITKVLSKIANKMAKKNKGVWVMINQQDIDDVLKTFPVKDIWGIGSRSAAKLNMLGIKTAYEFKLYKDEGLIQKLLTKTGRQVQEELRGVSCLALEEAEDKKNTGTSRSFGVNVYDKKQLQEALAHFSTHAALKLRRQNSVCYSMQAFIYTNPFQEVPQYYGQGRATFSSGTSDTLKIITAAHQILDEIYRPGFAYKKAGVLLNHIVPKGQNQLDLFTPDPSDNEQLNQVMDLINRKYGAHTIKSAACGIHNDWKTIADYKTQHYTTSWKDLLKVKI